MGCFFVQTIPQILSTLEFVIDIDWRTINLNLRAPVENETRRQEKQREKRRRREKETRNNTTKEKKTNQDINSAHNQQLQHKATTTTTTKKTYIPNGLHKRKSTGTIPVGTNETFFGCFQMQLHTNTPKRQRLMAVFV